MHEQQGIGKDKHDHIKLYHNLYAEKITHVTLWI
jgi:hypothetical protein